MHFCNMRSIKHVVLNVINSWLPYIHHPRYFCNVNMQIITAKCAAPIVVVSNSFFCDNQFIKRPIHNSSKNFWRPNKGAKTFFKQSKRFRFQYVMIMFSSSFWTHELTHVTEQRKGYLIILRSTTCISNDQMLKKTFNRSDLNTNECW